MKFGSKIFGFLAVNNHENKEIYNLADGDKMCSFCQTRIKTT